MAPPPGPGRASSIAAGVSLAVLVGGCATPQEAPPSAAGPGPVARARRKAADRRDKLVTPAWVRARLGQVVVLDVAWGEPNAYREGHVPGAFAFDTNLIERAPTWRFVPVDELKAVAERFGITKRSTVVLYGRPTMAAARVAVMLLHLGVDDVRLMDGGVAAWRAAGLPVETAERRPTPVLDFGAPVPGRPELVVGRDDVRALIGDPHASIVCTRSPAEHAGEVSGYREISARGRIRGSVWGRAGTSSDAVEALQDPDGTLRDPDDVAADWSRHGIDPDDRVVFYCGTGWRASLALFHAWLLGWERISLYDPGWFEWGADPANNPIETGPPYR